MALKDDVDALVTAAQAVQATVDNQAPTLADQVLAAVTPVLEAAGWTAPAELPAPTPAEGQ